MCILFIAIEKNHNFPLIIAANRDEFHARPTAVSGFWDNQPNLLAGRDLQANGTWMGVTRNGKIAALTNIRAPDTVKTDAVSRGGLVVDWLVDNHLTQDNYLTSLRESRTNYNGYNLVYGDTKSLTVYNNFENTASALHRGIYGLSNSNLTTPWPKVTKGVDALSRYIKENNTINEEALFDLLKDDAKATDSSLPDTGIGYEWEKRLSSIFIQSPEYGTRTSTLLLVDRHQQMFWYERRFNANGVSIGDRQFVIKA